MKSMHVWPVLLWVASARADDPYRHLLEPTVDAAPEAAATTDAVVGQRPRRARWADSLSWAELEARMDGVRNRIDEGRGRCAPVAASAGELLAMVVKERNRFDAECRPRTEQLRDCLSSRLRLNEMAEAVDSFDRQSEGCNREAADALAFTQASGQLRAGGWGKRFQRRDSRVTDNDYGAGLDAGARAEGRWGAVYRLDLAADANLIRGRGGFEGHDVIEARNEFDFDRVNLWAALGHTFDRGYFDLLQEAPVHRQKLSAGFGTGVRIDSVRITPWYRPAKYSSTNNIYNGIEHDTGIDVLPVGTGLGYRAGYRRYAASVAALYPSYSALRLLLDLSGLTSSGAASGDRTFLIGIEERRDRSRVARLLPHLVFEEKFGPFPGAAWLAEAMGFAHKFESQVRVEMRPRETNLAPTARYFGAEGGIRMQGPRWGLGITGSAGWERIYTGGETPENLTFALGLYPQFKVSGRLFVDLDLEFERVAMFGKIDAAPALWIDPYETHNRWYGGLKARYEY